MPAAITITDTALLRLIHLSSAGLPVGGYSFSQGLETAVAQGWVSNQREAAEWLRLVMYESVARVDLPLLRRLYTALSQGELQRFWYWNATVIACRETHELLLTETAMGAALIRLLKQLAIAVPTDGKQQPGFVAAFALAAAHWSIDGDALPVGFLWSWLENQVTAATKLVPLGQTMAQRLLLELGDEFPRVITQAQRVSDDRIGSSLPGLAMASSWHETQYSRLFRS